MKKNMGIVDRVLRIAVAVVIGILYFTGQISGTLALVLGALAIIFIATSFVGLCPLYMLLNVTTERRSQDKKRGVAA